MPQDEVEVVVTETETGRGTVIGIEGKDNVDSL